MSDSASHRGRRLWARKALLVVLITYWCTLFYATHTALPPGLLPGNSDKTIHFGAYAGLAVLVMSLRATDGTYSWPSVVRRGIILAAYGVFDELTQLLVNRNADLLDWLADLAGISAGLGLVTIVVWYWSHLKKDHRDNSSNVAASAN